MAVQLNAEQSYREADVVVDAEVLDPMNPDPDLMGARRSAALKVIRVWKGDVADIFPLHWNDSCDLGIDRKATAVRILLKRDPDFGLSADKGSNGLFAIAPGFDAEIDRIIGNKRGSHFVDLSEIQIRPTSSTAQSANASNRGPKRENGQSVAAAMGALAGALATVLAFALANVIRRRRK